MEELTQPDSIIAFAEHTIVSISFKPIFLNGISFMFLLTFTFIFTILHSFSPIQSNYHYSFGCLISGYISSISLYIDLACKLCVYFIDGV